MDGTAKMPFALPPPLVASRDPASAGRAQVTPLKALAKPSGFQPGTQYSNAWYNAVLRDVFYTGP
jgi:hypothetical protein